MTSGVYAVTNRKTGRQYIGRSRDCQARWVQHQVALVAGTHTSPGLQEDWNAGHLFDFDILEEVTAEWHEVMAERERYYLHERLARKGSNEYNRVIGHGKPAKNLTMQLPIDELAQVDAAAAQAQLSSTEFIRRAYLDAIRRLYEAEVTQR